MLRPDLLDWEELKMKPTFAVKNYKKQMDPFDVFLNGLLKNINIEINIDPRLKLINSKLEKHLKLIDPEKRNILMYCFECEVK